MARKIKQFRYYGPNDARNYPEETTYANLLTGNIFQRYAPILSLGVQGDPDLKFYINQSQYPIMLGATGIYELDIDSVTSLSSIRIDRQSLDNISADNANPLMIDIIYEGGGN